MRIYILLLLACILFNTYPIYGQPSKFEIVESITNDSLRLVVTKDNNVICYGDSVTLIASVVNKNSDNIIDIDKLGIKFQWFSRKYKKYNFGTCIYGHNITVTEQGFYMVKAIYPDETFLRTDIELPLDPAAHRISYDEWICGDEPAGAGINFIDKEKHADIDFLKSLKIEMSDGIIPAYSCYDTNYVDPKWKDYPLMRGCVFDEGQYNIVVTNPQNQCRYETKFFIEKIERPEVKFISDKEEICKGMKCMVTLALPKNNMDEFRIDWPQNKKEIRSPGKYDIMIWEKESECAFVEEFEVKGLDYEFKIHPRIYKFCSGDKPKIYTESNIPNALFQWYKMGKDKKWKPIPDSNHRNFQLEKGDYKYKVTATTSEGCVYEDQISVLGTSRVKEMVDFFKDHGFYELNISDIVMDKSSSKKYNLTIDTTSIENRSLDMSNVKSFKIGEFEVSNLDDLVEKNLAYFHNQYFGKRFEARAFITSNKSLCSNQDFAYELKAAFESKSTAFWIHLYKSENGQDKLFVLSNNLKKDGSIVNFPGTGAQSYIRKTKVNQYLKELDKDRIAEGNFKSVPENMLFIIMNTLLDVFPYLP